MTRAVMLRVNGPPRAYEMSSQRSTLLQIVIMHEARCTLCACVRAAAGRPLLGGLLQRASSRVELMVGRFGTSALARAIRLRRSGLVRCHSCRARRGARGPRSAAMHMSSVAGALAITGRYLCHASPRRQRSRPRGVARGPGDLGTGLCVPRRGNLAEERRPRKVVAEISEAGRRHDEVDSEPP